MEATRIEQHQEKQRSALYGVARRDCIYKKHQAGLRAYGVYPADYLSGHMIHSLPTNTIFAVVE